MEPGSPDDSHVDDADAAAAESSKPTARPMIRLSSAVSVSVLMSANYMRTRLILLIYISFYPHHLFLTRA